MLRSRHFLKIQIKTGNSQSYVRRPASSYSPRLQQKTLVNIGFHGYSLLAIPVVTFGLGTWQIYRRQWKLGVIENLTKRTSASPVPFPLDVEELDDKEYQKFELRGTFQHDKEVYIGPRSMIGDEKNEPSGMLSSGQSGYQVVTPFKLSDSNLTVLVNRGWVPRKKLNPFTRATGQPEGEVKLIGVYRTHEPRPQFVPQNKPKDRMFHFRDVESMARLLDTAPIFFDADINSSVAGGPVGGQTVVTVRNEHFSYILTWYSLSVITAFLWYRRFIKKLPLM